MLKIKERVKEIKKLVLLDPKRAKELMIELKEEAETENKKDKK